MNPEKAQKIVESLGVVEVLYNGARVWIEKLEGEDADVRYLETGDQIRVPVAELIEGGSIGGEGTLES
ncbi:MAG: small, acid-soluble spore protein, H family [Syntrophaceticus schinkii]|jgi:H-type small acid-soluble spore protein|nr:small, acid-soluble spore protein, H family [Syntrophaceticus schinkii]